VIPGWSVNLVPAGSRCPSRIRARSKGLRAYRRPHQQCEQRRVVGECSGRESPTENIAGLQQGNRGRSDRRVPVRTRGRSAHDRRRTRRGSLPERAGDSTIGVAVVAAGIGKRASAPNFGLMLKLPQSQGSFAGDRHLVSLNSHHPRSAHLPVANHHPIHN
jgi:hypothetical protein